MWRLDPAPILCFDGDSAGKKAAIRAALRALPQIGPERTLRFVELPPGQDPDDLVRGGGREAVEKLLCSPTALSDFIWRTELGAHDTSQPEGRTSLKVALREKAELIEHSVLSSEFRREFEARFWDQFGWGAKKIQTLRSAISESRGLAKRSVRLMMDRAVLLGLTRYPAIARENHDLVASLPIQDRKLRIWRDTILEAVREHPDLDEDALETILDASDASPIEKRDIQRDLAFSFFRRMADKGTAQNDLLKVVHVLVAEAEIDVAIADADKRFAETLDETAFEERNFLRRRKNEIRDELAEFESALAA
jgi:DNA primase